MSVGGRREFGRGRREGSKGSKAAWWKPRRLIESEQLKMNTACFG